MTLYAKAQKRFCLMVRNVARDSASAVAILLRLPFTRVISAASIAISVPVPIAMPASACTSAGASLMPSPAKATTSPCCCKRFTWLALSSGKTSAKICSGRNTDLGGNGLRCASIVASYHPHRETLSVQLCYSFC